MSTAIPGRHIDGMVRAFAHTDPSVPAGWTREQWVSYCGDPDGGRAPYRMPDPMNIRTSFERDAEDWRVD